VRESHSETDGWMVEEEWTRVKVYQLEDQSDWVDQGTARLAVLVPGSEETPMSLTTLLETCSETQQPLAILLALEEEGHGRALLRHTLDSRVEYARQGDTIVTWFDPASDKDLALSFQEAKACAELWKLICLVQRVPYVEQDPMGFEGADAESLLVVGTQDVGRVLKCTDNLRKIFLKSLAPIFLEFLV